MALDVEIQVVKANHSEGKHHKLLSASVESLKTDPGYPLIL